ncbi:glycosyltransferase family 2 protein [Patescibacteria group bacterium]|nr:MAG: glycosyltransferase family 2 protein [Patescibacteria group bacterium]
MELSVIILNYNTKNLLKECLRGIRLASPRLALETVVVDNASTDGSAEMTLSEFPEARLIRAERNLGYAGGNNLGLKYAVGRYVMIMNPDILIWPGSLEALVSYLDAHPAVGLAGPRLTNPDGSVQPSCYRFHTPAIPVYRRTILGALPPARRALADFLMEDFDHQSEREVDWLLGGALCARRQAVEEVGPLDESFFLYFDDTDWCRRFWEKGWRVVYYPGSVMVHFHERASIGGVLELLRNPMARVHLKSAFHYFRKYQGKENPRIRS